MQKHIFLENYGNDDVFSFQSTIFKVGRLREIMSSSVVPRLESALQELCKTPGLTINTSKYNPQFRCSDQQQWFCDGIDCEALKIGAKGWQKGKVKIRVIVEFCPDEPEVEETSENNQLEIIPPESPLDDLRRQLLNHENQPNNS
ncbi:MAG: KGK family protein [Oscillatoriales cyanobacterium]|nr:MAG: KGK family protein [Oscillatoriales cyanobacterium]TAD95864.1 MAG: KGK family protein [Oscillatoriales cyanobacterium]TAE01658.1 MAG: KGK family protein [Oscillatoriales cyanobacterium]TAF02420.1 MAG: KGK family protein [Oscillatoriales cyanobacterium]TAF31710.1 MAG: KGK family protein [Oscillatoriales cyanobacterium]